MFQIKEGTAAAVTHNSLRTHMHGCSTGERLRVDGGIVISGSVPCVWIFFFSQRVFLLLK